MKIEQQKEFKPLVITLETPEEYNALALVMDEFRSMYIGNPEKRGPYSLNALTLSAAFSDFFINNVT